MGDDTEQLEILDQYPLKRLPDKNFTKEKLDPDLYKDPVIQVYLKTSMINCIHHHEDLLQICKEFDKQVTLFLFGKIADTNFLLTVILFVIVSNF